MRPEIQDALLEPLIFHYERDRISDAHFCHLVRSILVCVSIESEQGQLVPSALRYMLDTKIPPHERPPGAPNSKPSPPNRTDHKVGDKVRVIGYDGTLFFIEDDSAEILEVLDKSCRVRFSNGLECIRESIRLDPNPETP